MFFKRVSRKVKKNLKLFNANFKELPWSFKEVLRGFQVIFKCVSKVFQEQFASWRFQGF